MKNYTKFGFATLMLITCFLMIACTHAEPSTPQDVMANRDFYGKLLILVESNSCLKEICTELLIAEYTSPSEGKIQPQVLAEWYTSVLPYAFSPSEESLVYYMRTSPDKHYFTFRDAVEGKVFVSNSSGEIIAELDKTAINLSFSPDSHYLAYTVPKLPVEETTSSEAIARTGWGQSTVKVLDMITGEVHIVTDTGSAGDVSWLPDSKHIVSFDHGYFSVGVDGTGQKDENGIQWWSSNGVYSIGLNADESKLILANAENDITYDILSWSPFHFGIGGYWSPNNTTAAIVTPSGVGFIDPNSGKQLWFNQKSLEWSDVFPIPDMTLNNFYGKFFIEAIWSSDGSRFAYKQGKEVFIVNYNTREVTKVTDNVADDSVLQWLGGDEFLSFVTEWEGQREIGLYNGEEVFSLSKPNSYEIINFVVLQP